VNQGRIIVLGVKIIHVPKVNSSFAEAIRSLEALRAGALAVEKQKSCDTKEA
jgi:hypothetical protein